MALLMWVVMHRVVMVVMEVSVRMEVVVAGDGVGGDYDGSDGG